MSPHPTLSRLRTIPTTIFDCLAILNATQDDSFHHLDIDLLAVLRRSPTSSPSNFQSLRTFVIHLKKALGPAAYGFSSFRHQMFYMADLKRRRISSTPYHFIVYPDTRHFFEWEIHSRVRSMLRTACYAYRRPGWSPRPTHFSRSAYSPSPFLKLLYEAYLLYSFSGITSRGIHWDILKTVEFSVKNLAIEALLATNGLPRSFSTSWPYLIEHLRFLDDRNIPTDVVKEALAIRKRSYSNLNKATLVSHFERAFAFYDDLSLLIFRTYK